MSTTTPKRSLVDPSETWDLSDLFQSFDHWQEAFDALPSVDVLKKEWDSKYKGKLHSSAETLYECLQQRDLLTRQLENLFVYANLRLCEDVTNAKANECKGKIESAMNGLIACFSFVEPEMLLIPNLQSWSKTQPLQTYSYFIEELIRNQKHILSEQEESILTQMQTALGVFEDIHSKWNNADLKFEPALDSKGQPNVVSNAKYSLNLTSFDRTLRKNTFQNYYAEIQKWRHTITSNYYGNMVSGSLMAKIRHFNGFLDASLFQDNIPTNIYHNLIDTVRNHLPILHESMALRKEILKLDKVAPYDRYVSLHTTSETENIRFSWEEGLALVLEAIKPLGSEYVQIATKGLTQERWIDRADNEGKRSGAFSWGTYDSRPYMLQTWNGTLGDVYTLAHELGHSMHSYYSHKHQPYHTSSYTIFVAEVASTLNEALLTQHILNTQPNTPLAKMVLSEAIENFEGTVLRQVLFATFERASANIVDNNESFTPDLLEQIYFDLNQEWYGPQCEYPTEVRYEWMRIPHFYSPFYVYKYATSYCASLSLAKDLLTNPEKSRPQLFAFLKAGGSEASLDILQKAGVDLRSPEPYQRAFDLYQKNIQILKEQT